MTPFSVTPFGVAPFSVPPHSITALTLNSSATATTPNMPLPLAILLAVLLALSLLGLWLHIKMRAQTLPGEKWRLRKDSLFRNRKDALNEKGQQLLAYQRLVIMAMAIIFALILALASLLEALPPPT